MRTVNATYRNGRVELCESVDWPDGTEVEVWPRAVLATLREGDKRPMTQWPAGFFERLHEQWGDEVFERPSQGEYEVREDW